MLRSKNDASEAVAQQHWPDAMLAALLTGTLAHSEYRSRIPNGEVVPGVRALGHKNLKGGGELNPFGRDFKAAGLRWTKELCRLDSDGDGESNGLELGDPCCVWSELSPIPPARSWRISHPGRSIATEGVQKSGMPMPNCTAADEATNAAKHASVRARLGADLATVQGASFTAFYFTNSFYARGHHQGLKMENGTKLALSIILGFLGMAWFEAWHGRRTDGGSERRAGGSSRCDLVGLCKLHLLLLLVVVVYVDVLSGLLHIVLDNPAFTTAPVIGPGAVGFQRHHHHPAGITIHSLLNFVQARLFPNQRPRLRAPTEPQPSPGRLTRSQARNSTAPRTQKQHHHRPEPPTHPHTPTATTPQEHLPGMCGLLISGLVPARWSAGANTNLLRVFLVEVLVLSCFMMAAHRWSHTQKEALSPLIVELQERGLLISHLQHSLHHVDYDCNFAIFTGWCNPALNQITAHVLHVKSRLWLGALVAWGATPLIVAHLCFYKRIESDGDSALVGASMAHSGGDLALEKQRMIA